MAVVLFPLFPLWCLPNNNRLNEEKSLMKSNEGDEVCMRVFEESMKAFIFFLSKLFLEFDFRLCFIFLSRKSLFKHLEQWKHGTGR